MSFDYTKTRKPKAYRGANFYEDLRKTAALVWQRYVDVRDAAVPFAANHIKNLKPPISAYFNAAANKVVTNEKKPDTRVPTSPAVAAGKGAKAKGGAVVLAARTFSKAIGAAFKKAASVATGLSEAFEDDDDDYRYYCDDMSIPKLAGFQPKLG